MSLSQLWVVCLGSLTSNYISKCTGIASKEGRKIWHNLLKHQTNAIQSIWAKHWSKKISAKNNPIVSERNPDFCYVHLVITHPGEVKKYLCTKGFFSDLHSVVNYRPKIITGQTNSAHLIDLNWAKLRPETNLLKEQTTKKIILQCYNSF